jgi:alkylhydroperoxidase/carboxymuconolactone decarboxylase family protein YurZ
VESAGLELKYRSLVVVSVLAAIGQNEELKTHLRGVLNLDGPWTSCVRRCSR